MTEPRLRDLYTWLESHRLGLIQHAGELAECAGWVRLATSTVDPRVLDRLAARCERISFELATALEALDRIHPPAKPEHPIEDDDTIPDCLREIL